MSGRYERLFMFDSALCQECAPVLIAAGALLKDTANGSVLAQIKLRSLTEQVIKAAAVEIVPFSIAGEQLGDRIPFQYLDLHVRRDEDFGQKTPVYLPDKTTRKFTVSVSEVVFEDDHVWKADHVRQHPVSPPKPLSEVFEDQEVIEQYRINYGSGSKVYPADCGDLWYCSCGALNWADEDRCHICSNRKEELFAVDHAVLIEQKDLRLKNERYEKALALASRTDTAALQQAKELLLEMPGWREADRILLELDERIEILQREAAIAEEQRKAAVRKRRRAIGAGIAAAAVIILASFLIVKVIIPNKKYDKAAALLEAGEFSSAGAIFEELGDYKDSVALIEECRNGELYQQAEDLYKAQNYEKAALIFKKLKEYRDSTEKYQECLELEKESEKEAKNKALYKKAAALMEKGDYRKAVDTFKEISDYKDVSVLMEECETAIKEEQTILITETHSYYEKCREHVIASGTKRADTLFSGYAEIISETEQSNMRGAIGASDEADTLWILFNYAGTDKALENVQWGVELSAAKAKYTIIIPLKDASGKKTYMTRITGSFEPAEFDSKDRFEADEILVEGLEADPILKDKLKDYPTQVIPSSISSLEVWLKSNELNVTLKDLGIGRTA